MVLTGLKKYFKCGQYRSLFGPSLPSKREEDMDQEKPCFNVLKLFSRVCGTFYFYFPLQFQIYRKVTKVVQRPQKSVTQCQFHLMLSYIIHVYLSKLKRLTLCAFLLMELCIPINGTPELIQIAPVFPPMSCFHTRVPSGIPHMVSCHLFSERLWSVTEKGLCSMTICLLLIFLEYS